jgi:putative spermidine/putrescine transport system substrate-binding protein
LTGRAIVAIGAVVLSTVLGGCGGGRGSVPGELERLGAPEGALHLVALPGYVEDGSKDPSLDWVTPFERRTGCRVWSTVSASPDEVARLMRTGRYDGVSARGDVSGRLVAEHLVAPVNTDLISSYSQIFPAIKHIPSNTVDGITYGIPNGRFANLLIWQPSQVPTPRDKPPSSSLIFDSSVASRYRGSETAYDNPMYIADAALYLRDHEPGLGIENIFELDRRQLDAALALLRAQRQNVGRYWSDAAENVNAFVSEGNVVGPAWQLSINRIQAKGIKLRAAIPEEGATGVSDTWMISSRARHPNCMYMWMNYIVGPEANAAVAEHTAQAPANEHACDLTGDPGWCDTYRAADEELFHRVRYWATPLRDCGDDRGDSCTDYGDWARTWKEVRGG